MGKQVNNFDLNENADKDQQHVDLTVFLEWLGSKVDADFLSGEYPHDIFLNPFFDDSLEPAYFEEFGHEFDGDYYMERMIEEGIIIAGMPMGESQFFDDDQPFDDQPFEDYDPSHGDQGDWHDGWDNGWEDDYIDYNDDYWYARGEVEWRTRELEGNDFDQQAWEVAFEAQFGGEDYDLDAIWDEIDRLDEVLDDVWEVRNARDQLIWMHRDFYGRDFSTDEFDAWFDQRFGDDPDVDDIYDEIDEFQERMWQQHDIENAKNELARAYRKIDGDDYDRDATEAWIDEEFADADAQEIWEAVDRAYRRMDEQRQIDDAKRELEKAVRTLEGDDFDEDAFEADFQDRFGGDDVHPEDVWMAVDEAWQEVNEQQHHEEWGEDEWGDFWGDYWEDDAGGPVDFHDPNEKYWEDFDEMDEGWEDELPEDMLQSFYDLLAELNQLVEILYELIEGTKGNDKFKGTDGDEQFDLGAGNDKANGGDGNDLLQGDKGNDKLLGGDGEDELDGGADNDKLDGGTGDDVLDGGEGKDKLVGGDGDDEVAGGEGKDKLDGGAGADDLDGGEGNDKLKGGGGADALDGGIGKDKLAGGGGGDELEGGEGNDKLAGGDGNDTYIFNTGDGVDKIVDTGGDKDKIVIEDTFNFNALEFTQEDDDLVITNGDDVITIVNHFSEDVDGAIETLELGDGGIKLDLVNDIDTYLA